MVSPVVTRQAVGPTTRETERSSRESPSKGRSTRQRPNNKTAANNQEEANASSSSSKNVEELAKIGPWRLGKTLGKGSSGKVKLAKHVKTGKYAAVKIVPKRALIASASRASMAVEGKDAQQKLEKMLIGIEREIVIMKLIEHPNVMSLYDVWETHQDLYLVLEYVEGGELFDYLVAKGRLREEEALHYFQQIIFGVDYCHRFNICHRDLKPENLLLDRHRNIKIADFGMAALEPSNKMLETSCGSPHYASPEIVAGKHYHGSASDTWSAGVVLYALLTGRLPFDDENIRNLLAKVKIGKFSMPQDIAPEAQDLIRRMLTVDPRKRITMPEILQHPWFNKREPKKAGRLPPPPSPDQIVRPVNSKNEIDQEILQNLQTLWHGADEAEISKALLAKESNWEKTFYILLMKYRSRNLENYKEDSARPTTRTSTTSAAHRHPKQFVASTAHSTMRTRRSTTRQSISSLATRPASPRANRHRKGPSETIVSPAKSRQPKTADPQPNVSITMPPLPLDSPIRPPISIKTPMELRAERSSKVNAPTTTTSVLNRPRHSSRTYEGIPTPVTVPQAEKSIQTNRASPLAAPVANRAPMQFELPNLDISSDAIILEQSPPDRSLSPINVPTVGDDRIQRFFQEVADTLHTMTAVQQRSSVSAGDQARRVSKMADSDPRADKRISDVTQFDDAENDKSAISQPAYQVRRVTPVITRATRDARTISRDSGSSFGGQTRPISRVRTSVHSQASSRPVSVVGPAATPMLPPLGLPYRPVFSQRSSAPPQTVDTDFSAMGNPPSGHRKFTAPVQGRNSAPSAPLSTSDYLKNAPAYAGTASQRPSPPSMISGKVTGLQGQAGKEGLARRMTKSNKENVPEDVRYAPRIQWSEDTRKISGATTMTSQSAYSDWTHSSSASNKSGSSRKDSGKYSWFASIFNFGPATYQLKSRGSIRESKVEAWRILNDMDIAFVHEDEYSMRCEARNIIDADGTLLKPVIFNLDFGYAASANPSRKGSISRRTSLGRRRKRSVGDEKVTRQTSMRSTGMTNVPGPNFGADGMIKIVLTQEKGSLATFKFIFTYLRRAWRLDEPIAPGIRLVPTPVVPQVVYGR